MSNYGWWTWPQPEPGRTAAPKDDNLVCQGDSCAWFAWAFVLIETSLLTGASMPLNFYPAAAIERVRQREAGANNDRQEQFATIVAASLAVLIVAAIAVLMGMV